MRHLVHSWYQYKASFLINWWMNKIFLDLNYNMTTKLAANLQSKMALLIYHWLAEYMLATDGWPWVEISLQWLGCLILYFFHVCPLYAYEVCWIKLTICPSVHPSAYLSIHQSVISQYIKIYNECIKACTQFYYSLCKISKQICVNHAYP